MRLPWHSALFKHGFWGSKHSSPRSHSWAVLPGLSVFQKPDENSMLLYNFYLSTTFVLRNTVLAPILSSTGKQHNGVGICWWQNLATVSEARKNPEIKQKLRSEIWSQRILLTSQDPCWSIKAGSLKQIGQRSTWIRMGTGREVVDLQRRGKKKGKVKQACDVSSWH